MVKRPVEPGVGTPADALRRTLREAEEEVTLLLRGRGELLPLLRRLDAIAEGLRTLEAERIDLRPERTRWESLCTQVQRGAERLVRHAQEGSDALRQAREELQPLEERWWWRLDLLAAGQRRRRMARTLRIVGIALLVLAVLGGAAYLLLRPDPLTAQKLRLYAAAERAIQEGRWEEAIARYQEATTVDPQDPEPWLRLGWAQERTGEVEAAQASLQEAASRFGDPFAYELALARLKLRRVWQVGGNPHVGSDAQQHRGCEADEDDQRCSEENARPARLATFRWRHRGGRCPAGRPRWRLRRSRRHVAGAVAGQPRWRLAR